MKKLLFILFSCCVMRSTLAMEPLEPDDQRQLPVWGGTRPWPVPAAQVSWGIRPRPQLAAVQGGAVNEQDQVRRIVEASHENVINNNNVIAAPEPDVVVAPNNGSDELSDLEKMLLAYKEVLIQERMYLMQREMENELQAREAAPIINNNTHALTAHEQRYARFRDAVYRMDEQIRAAAAQRPQDVPHSGNEFGPCAWCVENPCGATCIAGTIAGCCWVALCRFMGWSVLPECITGVGSDFVEAAGTRSGATATATTAEEFRAAQVAVNAARDEFFVARDALAAAHDAVTPTGDELAVARDAFAAAREELFIASDAFAVVKHAVADAAAPWETYKQAFWSCIPDLKHALRHNHDLQWCIDTHRLDNNFGVTPRSLAQWIIENTEWINRYCPRLSNEYSHRFMHFHL